MPLFAWALIISVASALVQSILVKPQTTKPAALSDFDIPQIEEGTPQAVFFGECWTEGWMVLWYGDFRTTKVKAKGGKK